MPASVSRTPSRHTREPFTTVGLYENTMIEGMPEVLRTLQHAGHRMWVATSKPHVYADRIVDHFGLRSFFRKVYGAELDGSRSRKADLLRHLLDTEQLDPVRTLMIGDREHDVIGARAADCATASAGSLQARSR